MYEVLKMAAPNASDYNHSQWKVPLLKQSQYLTLEYTNIAEIRVVCYTARVVLYANSSLDKPVVAS